MKESVEITPGIGLLIQNINFVVFCNVVNFCSGCTAFIFIDLDRIDVHGTGKKKKKNQDIS
jgi:hypothetical protein